jgi:hypothetical protein
MYDTRSLAITFVTDDMNILSKCNLTPACMAAANSYA